MSLEEIDDRQSTSVGQAVAQATGDQEWDSGLCPVVGIGASAGGLAAFQQLVSHLPEQTGLAFVLIQHLAPDHESQLTELLSKVTRLPVTEVTDGMAVERNHVYVIPPNVSLAITKGVLHLTPRGTEAGLHLPVDLFFRSLAEAYKEHAIGVVLSGTGSDGSLGLAEIKAVGGITFAQDEDSAEYSAMPQSAVASGGVDFVLPPDQVARELARIGQHPYLRPAPNSQDETEGDGEFGTILGQLRSATGVDFSEYRQTTIRRRIARRMALHQQESLPDYMRFLAANPMEVQALYRDMLINVTCFFRDAEVFEVLKTTVFPGIVKGKSPENPVRIWVPGCSTGQEAYSLAMAMLEFLDQQPAPPAIQIFGTDINDAAAIEKARPGIYPPSIEAEVSPQRLQRFFIKVEGGYRICKSIRDMCVFARQDLTSDPPFSRLDLVSCRNLLIYLSPSLQQRIIPTFHYALNPGGFLLLGPSESVGKYADLFEVVDRTHKIYSRTSTLARPYAFVGGSHPKALPAHAAIVAEPIPALVDLRKEADRVILGRFAPAAVLIDENLEILQFRGQTAPYLQPPSGPPTHNILKMARDSLFLDLRGVIDQARKNNATARRENVRMLDGHTVRVVNLEATPLRLRGVAQRGFLVLFMEAQAPAAGTTTVEEKGSDPVAGEEKGSDPVSSSPTDASENAQLRQELASVKDYLQSIIEQQNAANEQLQSANEEIRSANEELQSTNEEMQTAKEELQSTNEELRTVNDELQGRNQEVSRINDDLNNTLSSIKVPIVMLSSDLRIRRFTTAAGTLLNLIPSDLGRPFGNLKPIFDIPDLSAMLLDVIDTVKAREQEIQDRTGRWYLLAMHPYRTGDNRIDGVVLVLRDIDAEKRAKEQLAQVSGAKDHFLAVLSHELRTPLTPVLATAAMLLRDGRFDADTHEQLAVIHRNAEMEARLIDDLLDVTRIARGKVELHKQPVELSLVIHRAVEVCLPDIKTRKLKFTVDSNDGSYIVNADAMRLQQVFWNLLKNSIKFTPAGGCVGIHCRRDGDGFVIVEVNDSGAGIKPTVIGGIFNAFEQGGVEMTRRYGGVGLGLAISKSIVQMHEGTIQARSAGESTGATFSVRLPLLPAQATASPAAAIAEAPQSAPSRPLHILLVEDHGDTARIMHRLLSAGGHEVQIAADIATALKLALAQPFDLLLSDLGLPDGSGLDLMRAIRAKGLTLPGIAVSGYGMDQDMRQSQDAGFAVHLTKPVSLPRLAQAIATMAGPGIHLAEGPRADG